MFRSEKIDSAKHIELISPNHSTRNLILLGSILIGLGEMGYGTFILTGIIPTKIPVLLGSVATATWIFLIYGTIALGLASRDKISGSFFPNLGRSVQNTADPYRTSLWIHWIYTVLNFVNSLILVIAVSIALVARTWSPNWAVLAALTAIVSVYFNRLVFGNLGQRSEDNRGSSFALVRGLAKLSSKMFANGNRLGLSPLLRALMMLDVLFKRRHYRPKQLPAVQTTVEGLVDLEKDQMPFDKLVPLAESLALLPRREELPTAFDKFLLDMKWPGGFESVESKRLSGYELVTILVFIATALGTLLVIVPRATQDAIYNAAFSFFVAEGTNIIGAFAILVGIFYWPFIARYETDFWLVLKYKNLSQS